jgi:hypothetical protein
MSMQIRTYSTHIHPDLKPANRAANQPPSPTLLPSSPSPTPAHEIGPRKTTQYGTFQLAVETFRIMSEDRRVGTRFVGLGVSTAR